jgi:Zn-dependent M28 family amino/carboxypeptidase
MTGRDLSLYLRARLTHGLGRLLSRRAATTLQATPLGDVLAGPVSPFALSRLLAGRGNADREAAVARYLTERGMRFSSHRFASFEGAGENLGVEIGSGERVLLLIAHHDAVPGSPGANDNAAAVGILLSLLARVEARVPARWRVRFLFTACEELGYLGARAYVRDVPLGGVAAVLSLELCGIGDALALWDVEAETPFLRRAAGALEGLGLRRDEGYHVVGRIPVFGSDHRAFAMTGIPAYGLSIVPLAQAEALRRFVFRPWRSAVQALVRRPPPFDTYHTARDALATLEPPALERVARALEAIIAGLD